MALNVSSVQAMSTGRTTKLNKNISYLSKLNENQMDTFSSNKSSVSFKGSPINVLNSAMKFFTKNKQDFILDEQKFAREAHEVARKSFAKVRTMLDKTGLVNITEKISAKDKDAIETYKALGLHSKFPEKYGPTKKEFAQRLKADIVKTLAKGNLEGLEPKVKLLKSANIIKDEAEFITAIKDYAYKHSHEKDMLKIASNLRKDAISRSPEVQSLLKRMDIAKTQLKETKSAIIQANLKGDVAREAYEVMKKDTLVNLIKDLTVEIQSKSSAFLKGLKESRDVIK